MTLSKTLNITMYLWVFLWAVNLIGRGTDIVLLGGSVLIVLFLIDHRLLSSSYLLILFTLISFGIVYSITLNIYESHSLLRGFREIFIPVILYTTGYLSMKKKEYSGELNYEIFKNILLTVCFAMFVWAILNIVYHLSIYGDIEITNRMIIDIWNHELVEATAQGSRLTLITVLLIPVLFTPQFFNRMTRSVILVCIGISVLVTLVMANRSLFVIVALTLVIILLFSKIIFRQNNKKIIQITIFLIGVSLLLYLLYTINFYNIKTIYEESNFNERLQINNNQLVLEDIRIQTWIQTIKGLYSYPFGGSQTPISISSPHNLWLDVGYIAGIIPLAILVLITVYYVIILLKLLSQSVISEGFKVFLAAISVGLLLNFLIEPILTGHYHLFMVFNLQMGLMHGLVNGNKTPT